MKVSTLIDVLQGMNPNDEVHFSYNARDYWNTQVAPKVDTVYQSNVRYDDYHGMDKIQDDDQEDDIILDSTFRRVVVITA
jgi:hypothetical protein